MSGDIPTRREYEELQDEGGEELPPPKAGQYQQPMALHESETYGEYLAAVAAEQSTRTARDAAHTRSLVEIGGFLIAFLLLLRGAFEVIE